MAKKTSRGRKQDRARVAGGQDYEVRYEAKKTGKSTAKVKRAAKKAGPSRKKVDRALGERRSERPRGGVASPGPSACPSAAGPSTRQQFGFQMQKGPGEL